jgi:AraC-like DNA-binding protein
MFAERRPDGPLSLYVQKMWHCAEYRAAHRFERVLPTGAFHLIVDLSGGPAIAVGLQTRYTVLETEAIRSTMGVVFRPGGARRFFAAALDEFAGTAVPLESVWGRTMLVERLREAASAERRFAILEAELARRLAAGEPHPAVRSAIEAMHRAPSLAAVQALAQDAGISRRRFSQLFREQVGLPPKLYCRVRRFQAVVRQVARGGPIEWAAVAADGGYADQSHLAHEFREFSGMAPGAYLAAARPSQNHVVETEP